MRCGSPGTVLVCLVAKHVVSCFFDCACCLLSVYVLFVMIELLLFSASCCNVCVAVLLAMSWCVG